MKKTLFALFCVVLLFSGLRADVYIKSQMHTDPVSIMGQNQPATDSTIEQWFGKDKMAQVTDKFSTLVDLTRKVIYIINHNDRSYVETAYPLDLTKLIDPQFSQFLSMMKMSVKVAPTGKTQKIGNWNCSSYDMDISFSMMTFKSKVWATTDVPFDWNQYVELEANSMMRMMDPASIAEMKKIKGVHISTETSMEMMGNKINSNTKVVEISNKNAPAGVFNVPAGYTKKDKLDMNSLK